MKALKLRMHAMSQPILESSASPFVYQQLMSLKGVAWLSISFGLPRFLAQACNGEDFRKMHLKQSTSEVHRILMIAGFAECNQAEFACSRFEVQHKQAFPGWHSDCMPITAG